MRQESIKNCIPTNMNISDNHDTYRYIINLLQVALNGHQQITSNPNTHKTKALICQALILGKDDYAPL